MPRETIYPAPGPNWDEVGATERIEVAWSRDGGVQLASTRLTPGADRTREFIDPPAGVTQTAE